MRRVPMRDDSPMEIRNDFVRVSREIIETYRQIVPATIGHLDNARVMAAAIKPLASRVHMVGPAFTVRTGGNDLGALNQIEELVQPGDVLVVDRGGDDEHAVIGEFRALRYVRWGLAGCIVDGAMTDIIEIQTMRFPTFCRTVSAKVAKNIGREGAVGVPVLCGGVIVNPGELIVADDNGVVVLSQAEAEQHVEHGLMVAERERKWREEFAEDYKKFAE